MLIEPLLSWVKRMLNKILIKKGWSTQQLANATGISKRTLDHYRDGTRKISLENGIKIADTLDIDIHELIEEST